VEILACYTGRYLKKSDLKKAAVALDAVNAAKAEKPKDRKRPPWQRNSTKL
jgi:hypothetical protein